MRQAPRLQDVARYTAAVVDADGQPAVGVRVLGVDVERKRDLATFRVVQGDVEVPGVEQLADDLVDAAVELLYLRRPAGELRDAVERRLGRRGMRLPLELCLELCNSPLRGLGGGRFRRRL